MNANLSFLHLITQASLPVQLVMLLLVGLSIWSWWMIFFRAVILKRAEQASESFEEEFWSGIDLNSLYTKVKGNDKAGPLARIFEAGFKEFVKQRKNAQTQTSAVTTVGIMDATRRAMRAAMGRELDQLEHGLPGLATVASVSPYIGLLGTVWGIMNAFRGLASVGQATLAQVAPGIAEALIATAIGLFAAIPAVVAYNRFTTQVDRLNNRFDTFTEEFQNILQRQV
jgi:biopolymer transport protein TolQ